MTQALGTVIVRRRKSAMVFAGEHQIPANALLESSVFKEAGLVNVMLESGEHVGWADYNPHSTVAVRMLTYVIDFPDETVWLEYQIISAIERRVRLGFTVQGTALRIINDSGDGLPGLTVDSYGNTLLIEISSYGMHQRIPLIDHMLATHLPGSHRIFYASDATVAQESIDPLPAVGRELCFGENGLLFQIAFDPLVGSGFAIQHRDNRRLAGRWASGRRVLELFAHQASFSLTTLAAGAVNAVAVDPHTDYMIQAQQHAERNGLELDYQCSDIYDYLDDLADDITFDLIICHPPEFDDHTTRYKKNVSTYDFLIDRCMAHLAEHGLLMISSQTRKVNADTLQEITLRCAMRGGFDCDVIQRNTLPADFPQPMGPKSNQHLHTVVIERRAASIDAQLAAALEEMIISDDYETEPFEAGIEPSISQAPEQ